MLKKVLGFCSALLAIGSSMFVAMAIGDLVSGSSTTANSVLFGLLVFFGGLTTLTGVSAWRLLRSAPTTTTPPVTTSSSTPVTREAANTNGIDIALEAKILQLAAHSAGRITATEIALACQVSLDAAGAALDLLSVRGYADLAVTPDGDAVYVIKGFVSVEEKQLAEALVG